MFVQSNLYNKPPLEAVANAKKTILSTTFYVNQF